MNPSLQPGVYVFVSVPEDFEFPASQDIVGAFREAEGLSLILTQEAADRKNLNYSGLFARITLEVHSSLEAVGLTAAVSTALAQAGISANVVAAYHHDHIFVPSHAAGKALEILKALQG